MASMSRSLCPYPVSNNLTNQSMITYPGRLGDGWSSERESNPHYTEPTDNGLSVQCGTAVILSDDLGSGQPPLLRILKNQ